MTLGKSGEDYLEAILVLKSKNDVVRSVDIASHLGFSKPSVSRAIGKLRQDGLLLMQDDGGLIFTEEGRRMAEDVYRKHTLIYEWLLQLGVSESTAQEDACNMEHVISSESLAKIQSLYEKALAKQKRNVEPSKKKKKKKKE